MTPCNDVFYPTPTPSPDETPTPTPSRTWDGSTAVCRPYTDSLRGLQTVSQALADGSLSQLGLGLDNMYVALQAMDAASHPAGADSAIDSLLTYISNVKRAMDMGDLKRMAELESGLSELSANYTALNAVLGDLCRATSASPTSTDSASPEPSPSPVTTLRLSRAFWEVPAGGAAVAVTVSVTESTWTAAADADWVLIGSPSGGDGERTSLAVAANPGPARTATVTFTTADGQATRTVTVTQAARKPVIEVDTPVTLPWRDAEASETVTSYPAEWSVVSGADWLTASRSGDQLVLSAGDNTGPGRVTRVTLTADGVTKYVKVRQLAGPKLSVNRHSVRLDATGDDAFFRVVTDQASWTAAADADWVHLDATTGVSGDEVFVTADANTGTLRTAVISVTDATGTVVKTITVTQKGA